MYYSWSKESLEAGKRRLAGDTARAATTDEVKQIRREAETTCEWGAPYVFLSSRFERLLGDNFLQVLRLAPDLLDLIGRRGPRRVAGEPTLAGLRTSVSDDAGVELDFCLIFAP